MQNNPITLTKNAADKIKSLAEQDNKKAFGLKIWVYPGGCSGFQYGMDFVDEPEESDVVVEHEDIRIFVDKNSIDFLQGTSIDFVDSLQGSGFKIDNPNVTHSCGCGKSVC